MALRYSVMSFPVHTAKALRRLSSRLPEYRPFLAPGHQSVPKSLTMCHIKGKLFQTFVREKYEKTMWKV